MPIPAVSSFTSISEPHACLLFSVPKMAEAWASSFLPVFPFSETAN